MSTQKMNQQKNESTFGRYLKAARLQQNIHLDTISKQTRIAVDLLLLIEDENHAELPAEVYVKGFLRAYAEAVGVDASMVIQEYKESRSNYVRVEMARRGALQGGTNFWFRLVLVIFVLAAIISLTVYIMPYFSEHRPQATENEVIAPSGANSSENNLEQKTPATSETLNPENYQSASEAENDQVSPENETPAYEPGIFYLKVQSVEDTWLKVIVDKNTPVEYKLKKGEQLSLEATSGYNILLGDAENAVLYLNGNPVSVQGKRGQMVNIQLPRKN